MTKRGVKITVEELINKLQKFPPNYTCYFGGLDLFEVREKGDSAFFEFNQTVSEDSKGFVTVQNHILPDETK